MKISWWQWVLPLLPVAIIFKIMYSHPPYFGSHWTFGSRSAMLNVWLLNIAHCSPLKIQIVRLSRRWCHMYYISLGIISTKKLTGNPECPADSRSSHNSALGHVFRYNIFRHLTAVGRYSLCNSSSRLHRMFSYIHHNYTDLYRASVIQQLLL